MGVLMSILLSPLMNLPIPGVGSENGPQYATDINNSLTIIDGHNHSPGSGNQITPSGLDINSNLPMNLNFLTQAAGVTFAPQSSAPANLTEYTNSTDLFFVDGLGNNIQITASGGIAGTPGSIANLTSPASATYVAGSSTFVWQSGTSIAANMDFGSALLRNLSPNSTFALTLSPPANLTSNYTLTLPSLPSSLSIMTLDTSGNISAPYSTSGGLPGSAIVPASITETQMGPLSVGTPELIDASVTQAKRAPLGAVLSNGVIGTYIVPTSTTSVPGLGLTITTTGRFVYIALISNNATSIGDLVVSSGSLQLFVERDGSTGICSQQFIAQAGVGASIPVSSFSHIDTSATAGTHTYSINAQYITSSSGAGAIENCRLIAYEL